jgi:hypothetical protein
MGGEEEGERDWKGKEGEGNRIEGKGREWKGRGGRKRGGEGMDAPGTGPPKFWARTATACKWMYLLSVLFV